MVRSVGVADAMLVDRLTGSVRRSRDMLVCVITSFAPLLAIPGWAASGELTVCNVISVCSMVLMFLLILVYFAYVWGPRTQRRQMPHGTVIAAEVGPERITVRLGGVVRSLPLSSVARVRRSGGALLVRARLPAGALTIPDVLLTGGVGAELTRRTA